MIDERERMNMREMHFLAIPLLLVSSAACSQSSAPNGAMLTPIATEASTAKDSADQQPVSGLPFSQGRSFSTLDEYLAFRAERGTYDLPWYREIRPGVYELVTRRMPGKPAETFTREQLKEKFGFKS
jgi:hypothetical protein